MITPVPLVPGSILTDSTATYYTAPVYAQNVTIKEIEVINNDTVPRTVTVYCVPKSGTAGNANILFNAMIVQAGETKIFGLTKVIAAESTIQAKASAASVVTLSVSGVVNT